jgi:hypothetical protein
MMTGPSSPIGGGLRGRSGGGGGGGGLGFNPNPSQENLALGAGFPLLFGGGFGQVAGGLIGSMFGEGFGGQILGSALGQQLEDAITKTTVLDTALDLLDADKLRDSIVRVTGELEYQIEVLKKAGRADEARALAAAKVYKVTGLSAETIDNVANKTLRLQQSWEGLVGSGRGLVTAISGLSSIIPGLTAILDLTATVVRGWTQLLSLTLDVGTGLRGWFQNLVFGAGTADKVKEKFGGINEETEKIKAQLKSAVDQQLLSAQLGKKLLDIEKQRTVDASLQGKLNDIALDRQAKIAQIESTTANKRAEALLKYGGLKDAASQKELALLLKLIEAEATQGKETAQLVEARGRLVAINATLVEQDKVRIALLQMQGEIAQASESASQNVRAAQIQELEQRKQVALTLGDELSTVKSIYAQKKQGIDVAYAATQREAALKVQIAAAELASVEAQRARGIVSDEAVAQARNVYNTAVAVTQETLRGAAAVSQAAMSAANLEQRQQTVAAYTAQFASEAGRATNALNEAAAASANQVSYAQALTQAQTTINNVNIQSLQSTLATTKSISQRARIIDKIKTLEIDNARLAYLGTVSQIQAQLESLRIAYKQVEVKYLELQAVVAIAKAQGLLNRGYIDALDAQRSALRIAAGNLATGKEIARVGGQAATAVYNSAVSAAKLRASTALAAEDAGSFAGSMDAAANSMQRAARVNLQGFSGLEPWMEAKILQAKQGAIMGSTGSSFDSYIAGVTAELAMRAKFEKILSAQRTTANTQAEQDFWTQASSAGFAKFATGGYVTGPTMGLIGEGGESEYIIPSSKMAVASANYLAGGRGAGIMEGGSGGGSAPSINITTGPVIEFNGERYVTMRDMERGLQQMATNIYTGLRTPAGRYAVGTR